MIQRDNIKIVRHFKGGKGRFANWFVLYDTRSNRSSAQSKREMILFFTQQFGKVGEKWDFDYARSQANQWVLKLDKESDATLFSLKYQRI